MPLRLDIDHDKLTDSPYNEKNQGLFRFTSADTSHLVEDIMKGKPTGYLISGFRGSGKSSLINRIQEEVKQKVKEKKEINKFVFIHLNFAKYELRSILLRKLIRNFYLQLKDENKEVYQAAKDDKVTRSTIKEFDELFERTFYDVAINSNVKTSNKKNITFTVQSSVKELALIVGGIIGFIVCCIHLNLEKFSSYLPIAATIFVALIPFLKQSRSETKHHEETESTNEHSKTLFYDDEIAEYRILNIIRSLQPHVKPIFVLDELDKIENDKLVAELLNELKPLMLSGHASFIIVAGQQLYYNYHFSLEKNDSALSTIFSKLQHVKIFSAGELMLQFRGLIRSDMSQFTQEQTQLYEGFANYLIVKSRRIPRRFMTLLRQRLQWEGDTAYIDINETQAELEVYIRIVDAVQEHETLVLAAHGHEPAILDFLIVQLLIEIDTTLHSPYNHGKEEKEK